jgi:hypothetical protein
MRTLPGWNLNPEGRDIASAVWADNRWLFGLYALHLSGALIVDAAGILPVRQISLWNWGLTSDLLVVSFALLPILLLLALLWRVPPAQIQRRYLTLRSVTGVVIACLFVANEAQLHQAFKRQLGRSRPFTWDAALSRACEWLHFGRPAWEWLDPVFHRAALTAALDTAYWLWFPVVLALGCWVAWLPRRRLRARAYVTWGLLWILLGTLLAQLLPSAGPVYFHHFVAGHDPYAPLLAHLDSVDAKIGLVVTGAQRAVWGNLTSAHEVPWFHISAFPSLHVAIPVFFSLLLFALSRPAGVVMWAFSAIILIGSVYLGWHYALDGYVSIIVVVLLWWASNRLVGRSRYLSEQPDALTPAAASDRAGDGATSAHSVRKPVAAR